MVYLSGSYTKIRYFARSHAIRFIILSHTDQCSPADLAPHKVFEEFLAVGTVPLGKSKRLWCSTINCYESINTCIVCEAGQQERWLQEIFNSR